MKYTANLYDKNYNLLQSFWFRSQHNIGSIEQVWESAKSIADDNGYKYDSISVNPRGGNNEL